MVPPESYICHHGIKGQKWYIRRYQNKDGSLTEAGKRRYAKLTEKENKIKTQKKNLTPEGNESEQHKSKNPHCKKSVFDMSDDELNSEIERLGLEKKYKDYMKELYPAPKKKEALINGKKIVGDILTKSLTTVGSSVATNVIGNNVNKIGKQLGIEYTLYTNGKNEKDKNKKEEDEPVVSIVKSIAKSKKKRE